MSFADLTHRDFNDRLAEGAPTPGGGTAAALTGAMAAAAVEMVCNLTVGKDGYESVEADLRETRDELAHHRDALERLADDDADAFDDVMAAFRMDDGPERTQAIQTAMQHAAEVPMETATRCLAIIELAAEVAAVGNPNAVTDAGAGGLLANAALETALYNVRINLVSIDDEGFVDEYDARVAATREAAAAAVDELRRTVDDAL